MQRPFWIASYPKAGNTWVRFILADLLAGPITSAADVSRLIPDTHREAPAELVSLHRGSAFLKTHRLPERVGVAHGRDAGALYVARNPLDLFCSITDYRCVSATDRPRWLADFAANQGVADLGEKGIGTFPENIAAWLSAPIPVMAIRYEDLSADPIATVTGIARRLGVQAGPKRIAATVKRCSFQAMRVMEEAGREGPFAEPDRPAGWRFMNRGRVGAYRELLTPAEIDRLARAFAPIMDKLGYGLDADRNLVVRPAT